MSDEKPWQESEFRTIIEDARARHSAVVTLMYHLDQQAIGLLRLYATLGVATASGALAGFGGSQIVTLPMAWALAFTAIVLIIGAALCFFVLRPTRLSLPGRDPDFWEWAIRPDVERLQVVSSYLETLKQKAKENKGRNRLSAFALFGAKACGFIAPLVALTGGYLAP